MEDEIWKPVPGMEYIKCEASSLGRIRALQRRDGRRLVVRKQPDNGNGYLVVSVAGKLHRVHRLVCSAFHGQPPDGFDCCHADGSRMNNTPDNLRWGTRKENMADKVVHGTTNRGELHGKSKLSVEAVLDIRSAYATGELSLRKLALNYGVSHQQVSRIIHNKTWSHI